VLAVARCGSDGEAVALANDCAFGLGSAVFSRNVRRANAIGAALEVRGSGPCWEGLAVDCLSCKPLSCSMSCARGLPHMRAAAHAVPPSCEMVAHPPLARSPRMHALKPTGAIV